MTFNSDSEDDFFKEFEQKINKSEKIISNKINNNSNDNKKPNITETKQIISNQPLLNYIKDDNLKHTITHVSYGIKRGSFAILNDSLTKICNTFYFDNYALVEKKTIFYKLMFDFDFKESHTLYKVF